MKLPLILLSWYAASCLWSVYLPYSLQSVAMVGVGVGLCYATRRWPDVARCCIFGLLAVNVGLGLLQVSTFPWIEDNFGVPISAWIPQAVPPAGLNGNKNLLASLIVGAGPVAATVTPLVWFPCAVMLLEVSSKASFVACAAMGLYWGWWRVKRVRYRIAIAVASVALLAGMVAFFVAYRGKANSLQCRIAYTSNSARILAIWPRPVQGFGPGTTGSVYYHYQEPVVHSWARDNLGAWPMHLHNDWMQYALELGIPGLALYLAILGMALYHGRGTAAGVALFGLSVNAAMDFPLQTPAGCWLWWALVGLCYAKSRRDGDQPAPTASTPPQITHC